MGLVDHGTQQIGQRPGWKCHQPPAVSGQERSHVLSCGAAGCAVAPRAEMILSQWATREWWWLARLQPLGRGLGATALAQQLPVGAAEAGRVRAARAGKVQVAGAGERRLPELGWIERVGHSTARLLGGQQQGRRRWGWWGRDRAALWRAAPRGQIDLLMRGTAAEKNRLGRHHAAPYTWGMDWRQDTPQRSTHAE